MKKNTGISMITLIITIIVIIILSVVAMNTSTKMIDKSTNAKEDATVSVDDDEVRALLTYVATGVEEKAGVPLIDESLVVVNASGDEYGTGFYIIPGGEDEDIDKIKEKSGYKNIKKYKNLSASYVVDYESKSFLRIKEVLFK